MGEVMKPITVSFKENERFIYDEICKHSGKAGWIKDVLADYIKNNRSEASISSKNANTEFDVANFLKF